LKLALPLVVDLVATRAAAGLLLSALGVGALVALSRLAGRRQALALPGIAIGVASVLSWQALVSWTWAPVAVMVLLGAGCALVLWRTGWRPEWRRPGLLATLPLAVLALDALYASFPDYRYDQWNYHLVVPRAVKTGPLAPPILNDHLAFTGVWEYLFTVPRALSNDDLFNQSAANSFSWLLVAVALYGLVCRLRESVFPRGPAAILVLAWTIPALPDQPGLMNAKPDPVLFLAALVVVDLLSRRERSRLDAFLLGFYFVAPLALKVTWLHFAAVMVPVAAWAWPPPWRRAHVAAALAGVLAGGAATAPFLVKNVLLFGNPIHPVQWGPFHSSFWSPAMEEYWRATMAPARHLGAWADTLVRLPLVLLWHLWILALPVLVLGLAVLGRRLRHGPTPLPGPAGGRLARVGLAFAFLHLLTWPLFFHANVGARFVMPGLAALVVVLWAAMGTIFPAALGPSPSRLSAFLFACTLLLPSALFGHLPTKASRLATWGSWSVGTFVREGPAEWRMLHDMWSIDRHRRETRPGAGFRDAVTLVDTHGVYLLEGASVQAGGVEYEWQRARARCVWDLLIRLDVRYVFARTGRVDSWMSELQPLAAALRPLSPAGQAFAVDPSFLERRLADDPACRADRPDE
jgi:hypothetical protein